MTTPPLPMGQSSSVTREVFRRGIRLDPMALLSLIRLRFDLMHDSRFTFNSQPQELWSMDRLVREESLLSAHFPCLACLAGQRPVGPARLTSAAAGLVDPSVMYIYIR